MYTDIEMWRDIRRRVAVDGESKRLVCREYGIHFKTLQKILIYTTPPEESCEEQALGHHPSDGYWIFNDSRIYSQNMEFPDEAERKTPFLQYGSFRLWNQKKWANTSFLLSY